MKTPLALATIALFALTACNVVESEIISSNDGHDRNIEIVNDSDSTITQIRARNTQTDMWTGNLLNGARLHTGDTLNVLIDDGSGACVYVLRTTYLRGHNQITSRTYNFCEFGGLNYGN